MSADSGAAAAAARALRDTPTLLPTFGEFTGGAPIARAAGDRVVAIGDGRLYEIPAPRPAVSAG